MRCEQQLCSVVSRRARPAAGFSATRRELVRIDAATQGRPVRSIAYNYGVDSQAIEAFADRHWKRAASSLS
jgi:hypothetical protein